MIHHRVRPSVPVLRGFLILVMILLFLPSPEACAYVPPPVPLPFEAEGDGDDFYCRLESQPARPGAGPVAGEGTRGAPVLPAERIEARTWETPEIERFLRFRAVVARWAGYLPVVRGF